MKIKHGMILAAGLGKRMQPVTLKTPKPLIQIGKKNLLERAIELLLAHGVEEIAINVHHLPDQIKDRVRKDKIQFRLPIPRPRKSPRDQYILNKNILQRKSMCFYYHMIFN